MGLFEGDVSQTIQEELAHRKMEKAAMDAELREKLPYRLSFQRTSILFREKYRVFDSFGKTRYLLKTSRYHSDRPYLKLYRAADGEEIICVKARRKRFNGWVFTLSKGKQKVWSLTWKDFFRGRSIVLSCLGCTIEREAQHRIVRDLEGRMLAEVFPPYYVRYDTPQHRTTALLAFLFCWLLSLLEDWQRMEHNGIS